jgi:hypothetical protein
MKNLDFGKFSRTPPKISVVAPFMELFSLINQATTKFLPNY